MISKNFFDELENIANDRHLDKEEVQEIAKNALMKAVEKEFENDLVKFEAYIEFEEELKKVRVYKKYYVVNEIDPETYVKGQITLETAKTIRKRVKVGEEITKEVPMSEISRKGAIHFKKMLIQDLKTKCNQNAFKFFNERINDVVTATIVKVTDKVVVLNLGFDTLSFMPISEGLFGENYIVGNSIKVTITSVEDTTKGPKVLVSRNNRELVKKLLELHVPEIKNGDVEVIKIAREPGLRTKIRVKSNNINVDPLGACVGPNGSRIKELNKALNGERIDIYEDSEDPVVLISRALSPAKCISVLVDEELHKSIVIVPDDQLSLAIGKSGLNARLAYETTLWKIDIKDETSAYRDNIRFKPNVKH